MDHLLEFFHSEHDEDLLDVDINILQSWLVVAPHSKLRIVSTVLFHKYGGANVEVTNYMSHFCMLVPTKATVKLANVNTVHAQGIGILLCRFPNCSIINPVVKFYYFPVHPSNTISSVAIKLYVGFQIFTSEPIEHCGFVGPQGHYWISPYQTQKNLDSIQIKNFWLNPHIDRNIVIPTVWSLSKQNLSHQA